MASKDCMIGITCDYETFTDRRGCPASRFLLHEYYVRAVESAQATVILLPISDPNKVASLLPLVQGLVISGGDADVPPDYYGQTPRPALGRVVPARAAFDRALLLRALAQDMPILGVCGGMQLLNVVQGGTLYQDLSERPGTQVHEQPQDKRQPHHTVRFTPGSHLHRAYGTETLEVNSTHHQLVDAPGKDVEVTGTAPDHAIEAIELRHKTFAVGVQWHPEAMNPDPHWGIYHALVQAARAFVRP